MMSKIYEAIEEAITKGVPPQYVSSLLINAGWPPPLVNQALNAWLLSHGRLQHKTNFRKWLRKYQQRAFPSILVMVGIGTLNSAVLLLKPWPTKVLVDSVFGRIPAPGPLAPYTHTPTLILITSLLTIAIFLLGAMVASLRDFLILKIGFWLNRDIKEESFRHILHLPLYHQERLAKGDYVYRQNVVTNSLSDLVLGTTSSIAESIIMIVGVLVVMMFFSIKLTIISIVLVPFLFVLIRLFGPVLGRISRALTELASKTSSAITESVDNAETVQSFTLEEKQISTVNRLWLQSYELTKKSMIWGRLFRTTNSFLIILGTSAVMYFGGTMALRGEISLGQLMIFMTYMGFLLGPIENVATQITTRNQKLVDVSRIYEVLSDHEGIEYLRRENHFPIQAGQIEFQNVSYAYNNTTILKNINLKVHAGEKVAIIGPSGSGKTTVLKLLPLFIEPSRGRILIDNIDIQTVSLKELRQKVTWIAQSPQLFSETIFENLLDANIYQPPDNESIKKMITIANVHEFLPKLPLNLDTPAGEGGGSLSGGQRQRVAIARGLLKNAPIVCMDEPTAALDSKSENYIRDSLKQAIQGKTVLMVTHRKSLLTLMDTIYVLEDGVLKNVNQLGGIDTYLQKIEGDEKKQDESAEKFGKLLDDFTAWRTREHRSAQERQEQQAKIPIAPMAPPQGVLPNEDTADDVTVFIDHS